MTKDFSQHAKIIAEFRGGVSKSDFESKFSSMAKSIPKTERFLLKMELKRLAGSCMRLIDLRGHVDGECRAYDYEGKTHYLDSVAIRVFEENVAQYGEYTFGVYEAVNNTENNFRVIYQKEKHGINKSVTNETPKVYEKLQYTGKLRAFGPYHNRIEERMNFAISVKLVLAPKEEIEVLSSDISVQGCRLRVKGARPLEVGQHVELEFTGMAQEFQFGEQSYFDYEIKNIQFFDDTQLVGLQRSGVKDIKRDPFMRFMQGYIQGNKRRYKVNLDNTISALQARSIETFALPKLNELPIFIEQEGQTLTPKYSLTCPNNREYCYYWRDENKQSTLANLATPERLKRLQKLMKLGKSLLVYSFKQVSNGKVYFYTADAAQLKEDREFKEQFLGFAANKNSFAVTDLSMLTFNKENAFSPLTLANTLSKKNEYLNLPPSEEVNDIVDSLAYIVVAQNLTEKTIVESYKGLSSEGIDTSKVKLLGHKKSEKMGLIDEVGINYKNQRHESRFKYETPAKVSAEGVSWQGNSIDFSTAGLKLVLDKPCVLSKGEVVNVSFPNLQKITSAFDLKDLPYEVLRINKAKTILNLRVFVEKHQHIGRSFFKLLIDKNRNKLKPDDYALVTPGLAKALRNLYAASVKIPNLIVQISGSRYKAETITCSDDYGRLLPAMKMLSNKRGVFNLYPLMSDSHAQAFMTSKLKKMQSADQPLSDILYISIRSDASSVDQSTKVKLLSQFESVKLRKMFVSNALKTGDFYAIQLKVSRTDEADMEYLNPELAYIGSYAIHRGKQLEQEIWSVAGVVQLYDITHEVIARHSMSQLI